MMWTNRQFWKDATWRGFRTFCQSLAGLLTVEHVSANLNASWLALIYASGVAALISLLQSVDRERAVGGSTAVVAPPTEVPAVEVPAPVSATSGDPAAADYQP
jgi:hypothetical protein